ncbi:MAG TPA: L-aspartate oxidase [Ktedonobacteraceae bacterium]|nr:L-aspartate oxidase [Ktedonobacteraceae bacterium]
MANSPNYDIAVIGGGIAGLSLALRVPGNMRVALFTKGQLGESNTRYAQGGLTVALGEDDSPQLHYEDTMAAGAGLCDEAAVRILTEQAPLAVRWLMRMGVQFDRAQPGSDEHATKDGLLLGREAAHSRWRVLHAGGDATGAEIERALIAALRQKPSVTVYEEAFVSELIVQEGVCIGVRAMKRDGEAFVVEASSTVLANGGAGGLWLHTSNPAGATADGIALAWRAGAALTDLEFMQFHPTVLVAGNTSHLISEAVRGEGAYLLNHAGERFMLRYAEQAELAPRDVVARAILSEMLAEGTDCQYLDLRHLFAEKMYARFPTISAICRTLGLDLAHDLIPVAPAAHYCMGGVMVDTHGQTTLPCLYAVGEVACTGVHGANRLASNSLLEGLVFGLRVADKLADGFADAAYAEILSSRRAIPVALSDTAHEDSYAASYLLTVDDITRIRREVRQLMWQYVSLRRDEAGLLEARQRIEKLREEVPALEVALSQTRPSQPRLIETINMLQAAQLVIAAALQRHESRGSHWRSDYTRLDEQMNATHYVFVQVVDSSMPVSSPKEVIYHA